MDDAGEGLDGDADTRMRGILIATRDFGNRGFSAWARPACIFRPMDHPSCKRLLRRSRSFVLLFLPPLLLSISSSAAVAEPQKPSAAEVLAKIHDGHPRLLASGADFTAIKRQLDDPHVAPIFAGVKAHADAMLARPVCKYELRDGVRLLYVSREVRDLVLTLGLAYRLTGDVRYAERLWAEVDAASKFPDWHPAHFLDTAEMTCAMAVAYDWLYERWTDGQRKQLQGAIVRLGLEPALKVYRSKDGGFSRRVNNWNQVCNGGILTGALVVAKDDHSDPAATELAGDIISRAVASLPIAMKQYAPDGAWGEGPGYWTYATEYNCIALAALRSACGTDFGLAQMPGFSKTGDMPLAFTGPLGLTFNYADAGPGFGGASALFWLASAFDAPAYAAFQIPYAKSAPRALDLLWGTDWIARNPDLKNRPLDAMFHRDNIVYLRSAWADPRALFVAFKGGDNRVNHGHLDLGSFVFDAHGQRWAVDVGPDDYNRPGYFNKTQRWTFYRCRAEGNNCLLINPGRDPDQSVAATADVTQFDSEATRAGAVVDLTHAYEKRGAASVRRGFALIDDRTRLLVQDEVRSASAGKPLDYWWFMHTDATIDVSADEGGGGGGGGATATLKKNGETLTARIVSPAGARFTVMAAKSLPTSPPEPPAAERSVVGWKDRLSNVRKLTIHIEKLTDARVAVVLTPGVDNGKTWAPALVPLSEWPSTPRTPPK
jgi:hypothetical protein